MKRCDNVDLPMIPTTRGHIGSPSLVFAAISLTVSAHNSPPMLASGYTLYFGYFWDFTYECPIRTTFALPAPPPCPWSFSRFTTSSVSQSTKAKVAASYNDNRVIICLLDLQLLTSSPRVWYIGNTRDSTRSEGWVDRRRWQMPTQSNEIDQSHATCKSLGNERTSWESFKGYIISLETDKNYQPWFMKQKNGHNASPVDPNKEQ